MPAETWALAGEGPGGHFSNGIKDLMKFLFTGKKKNDLTNNLFKMAHFNQ